MLTRQELEGNWNQVKGSLREKWGQLTDDDLDVAYGDAEQLVGVVQKKTGRTKKEVEAMIENSIKGSESRLDHVKDSIREFAGQAQATAHEYSQHASEQLGEQYAHAAESVQDGIRQAEAAVKRSPLESIAVTFGVGLIAGVVVGLAVGRRDA